MDKPLSKQRIQVLNLQVRAETFKQIASTMHEIIEAWKPTLLPGIRLGVESRLPHLREAAMRDQSAAESDILEAEAVAAFEKAISEIFVDRAMPNF